MRTTAILSAFFLSATLLTAQQNTNTSVKVRVKKTENVNGVEKSTDTTYMVSGPVTISSVEELSGNGQYTTNDGKTHKIVIVTDKVNGDNVSVVDKDEIIDEQVKAALKEAGVDGKNFNLDKVMVINDNDKSTGSKSETKVMKVVIITKIKITDVTEEDAKLLEKETGLSDNKLAVDNMNFYPNPNNGKFNLHFNLAAKGTTEVSVLNMEGKSVYSEELKEFTGSYDKEIDISSNPKGIYFVKIKQGTHAQLKKIVLD